MRDFRLAGEVITGLRRGNRIVHDRRFKIAALVRLEDFKRDLKCNILRETLKEFLTDFERRPAPVVSTENHLDFRIHFVNGTFDRVQKRRIIAAGIPSRARTRIRDAVHDAVAAAFARGCGVLAGKLQRLADKTDRARFRIMPCEIAVNGIEELLRVRVIGMFVTADIVVEHHVDSIFGRPLE